MLAEFEREQAVNAEQKLANQGLKEENERKDIEIEKLKETMQLNMELQQKEIAMLKEDRKKYRTMLRQHGIAIPPNTSE